MSVVTVQREPPLRRVRLDTGTRNVLTLEAVDGLQEALSPDLEAPVVVLSGRSDGFCSGLDNATLATGARQREELLTRMGELLFEALIGPTRIVAVCEGHAVAAGAMLLLVSDARIGVSGSYKVGFTEPGLGMPLPALPAILARERLDRRRLHELAVLGRIVGPEKAADFGFLDELTTRSKVEARAHERATEIAQLSDAAYRGSLRSVWGDSIEALRALVDAQSQRLASLRSDSD